MKTTSSCPSCGEGGILAQANELYRKFNNRYGSAAFLHLTCKHCGDVISVEPEVKTTFTFETIHRKG